MQTQTKNSPATVKQSGTVQRGARLDPPRGHNLPAPGGKNQQTRNSPGNKQGL